LYVSRPQAILSCIASAAAPKTLQSILEGMSEDERNLVSEDMKLIDVNPENALSWALARFNSLFRDSVIELLRTHPPDEMKEKEEEGGATPFWGGARRLPTPLKFDAGNSHHRTFILLAATLWGKGRGAYGDAWERDQMRSINWLTSFLDRFI